MNLFWKNLFKQKLKINIYIFFQMEDISSDKITKLRIQIEYYLSDKNLEGDKFFNEKIREDLNVN